MAQSEEFSDVWELSKENVRPRKQGRSVSSISVALQPQDDQVAKIKVQRQTFESELRTYTGEDPLDTWDRYIRWTEDVFPKGGKDGKLRILLERCITQFKDEEMYKDDLRYVGAWVKFASFVDEPTVLYTYMFDQDIGCKSALLYDAWALALEDFGNIKKANAIYQEGLRRNAEPFEDLSSKYSEFQARVTRSLMTNTEPMDTEGGLEEDSRTALGQLKFGKKSGHVGTARTGSAKTSSQGGVLKSQGGGGHKHNNGLGFQIFNDENTDPRNVPQQTGEWETVPKTGTTSRENEQKPGVWTKAKVPRKGAVASAPQAEPAFTIHVDEGLDPPLVTPHKNACVDSQVLSVRKADKPSNPLAGLQQPAASGGLQQTPMYCKAKVYCGLNEFSLEELRAAEWRKREQEKEQVMRMLEEERKMMQDRLETARNELQMEKEFFREQMNTQRDLILVEFRNLMAKQQEELERQRRILTQNAHNAVEVDIQERMERQLNVSHTPSNHLDNSERLTRQLNFDDLTAHGNTENLQLQQVQPGSGTDRRGHRQDPSTSLNSSQRTPVFNASINSSHNSSGARPKSRGPTPESGSFYQNRRSMTAPSPTVNTQEALKVVRGMFNVTLESEAQFGWTAHESSAEASGPAPVSAPASVAAAAAPAPTAGQQFVIYDETLEKKKNEEAPMVVDQQDPKKDQENTPPKDYRPSPRRANLAGYLLPALDIPVDETGEHYIAVETEKVRSGSTEEYIEQMPQGDQTLAPLGSSESFAAAACMSSTPYWPSLKFGSLPDPSVSNIKTPAASAVQEGPQSETQPCFDDTPRAPSKTTLSPIMEGSTEGSGEDTHQSTTASSRHHVTTSELNPTHLTPVKEILATLHEIDLFNYVAPEADEKTEALLSMSIMINPCNPFDEAEIASFLSSLSRPLDQYENYHSFPTPLPEIVNQGYVSLGDETYTIESHVGTGGFGIIYQAKKFDVDSMMCDFLDSDEDTPLALKVQKPACPWEFYICSELAERLRTLNDPMNVCDSIMSISSGYFYTDGSILVTDFIAMGSLLDFVNKLREFPLLKTLMEPVAVYMTIEMLHILEKLHKCEIIHGDIKPDNFLIREIPVLQGKKTKAEVFGRSTRMLKLIDFGRSIDMTKYSPGTTFLAKNTTDGFQCIEMKTNQPWTFQTDMFGLIGTIHVLIFQEYMKVYQSQGKWHMTGSFQRKWNTRLWKNLFNTLLNIPSCDDLPDLCAIRHDFEEFFMSDMLPQYNTILEEPMFPRK